MTGDLHCHTVASDGSLSIAELLLLAGQNGLSCLSITDHDTIASFDRLGAFEAEYAVKLIPGVELSCFDYRRGRKVHLLCYFPRRLDELRRACEETTRLRTAAGEEMIQKTMQRHGVPRSQIARYTDQSESIYKQHIMHALMDAGYTTGIYGALFDRLFHYPDGSCYVDIRYPDVHEMAALARRSGGAVVLAHPRVYNSFDLLSELAQNGEIDGVEVWHSRNGAGDEERLFRLADRFGLLKTGGSDFHGMYNSRPVLPGGVFTPGPWLEALFQWAQSRAE